jgi:mRNA interferase ChpB
VRRNKYERGDIVRVCLNPVFGRAQQGDFRPCLVLSTSEFNQLGTVLVAPITQGGDFSRIKGFTVSLSGCGTDTQGVVLINSVRMLDLDARKAKKIESIPDYIVDDVLAHLITILE